MDSRRQNEDRRTLRINEQPEEELRMKSLPRHLPIAFAVLTNAAFAQSIEFNAEEGAPPIYLYQDAQGAAYTLEVTDIAGKRAVRLKPVSMAEVQKNPITWIRDSI
jgi:hypothetical protein